MEYHVGDTVRILDRETIEEKRERDQILFSWNDDMFEFCDQEYVITSIEERGAPNRLQYYFANMSAAMRNYMWSADMFELAWPVQPVQPEEWLTLMNE